ncbi:capsule biosynthesis GfcC family protein [Grimontia kaedaensis]|uniref:Capsule biosynthesis GfcC family protein n=1 Tax=Grimontia kaedaensis TaxID=2872157 RepID=A0ABY4WWK4_9GAMM|nr:capsule biosynthesis GfcC family protein [Grimontia kaedaensis]USH03276.1 capsule biosynthesis GfcC family protein [Grimontia kaedaensis]
MKAYFSSIRWCIVLALLAVSTVAHTAEQTLLTVKTAADDKRVYHVTFDGAPRVSQVVSQGATVVRANANHILAHNTDTIFWQGAGLFDKANSADLNTLKARIENQLDTLKGKWKDDAEKLGAVSTLSNFLTSSTFASRISVTLDEDFYLAGSKVNPLVRGDLMLLLPRRPNNVWIIGAVTKTTDADFSPVYIAHDYLGTADTLNTFGISEVFVVQPNGELETHPVAYWNEVPKNVAPGAVIFVPFQGLPSEFSSLNRDIPRLLQHRVM